VACGYGDKDALANTNKHAAMRTFSRSLRKIPKCTYHWLRDGGYPIAGELQFLNLPTQD
jgi:hypothetical protein